MRTKNGSTLELERVFDGVVDQEECDRYDDSMFSMPRINFDEDWFATADKLPKIQKMSKRKTGHVFQSKRQLSRIITQRLNKV